MTLEEFNKVLEKAGYPVAFRHFNKNEKVEPPFICYITPSVDCFAADGKTFYSAQEVQVELYTVDKDINVEHKVEEVIADFYYQKDEGYIESERMYMVAYRLTL